MSEVFILPGPFLTAIPSLRWAHFILGVARHGSCHEKSPSR